LLKSVRSSQIVWFLFPLSLFVGKGTSPIFPVMTQWLPFT
jgi:hypothetical protein